MANEKQSVFATLNVINCNEHTEKKNNLTYLSWAWAWQMVKQNYPDANYTIYEDATGTPYFTDGRTCWVKTGVTIEGIEHIEYLPIMDFKNNSIPLEKVTSMDMNKAIQRSLTKCCARHGLGLYIYAGEDLPDEEQQERKPIKSASKSTAKAQPAAPAPTTDTALDDALAMVSEARTAEDFKAVWGTYRNTQYAEAVKEAMLASQYYPRKH